MKPGGEWLRRQEAERLRQQAEELKREMESYFFKQVQGPTFHNADLPPFINPVLPLPEGAPVIEHPPRRRPSPTIGEAATYRLLATIFTKEATP